MTHRPARLALAPIALALLSATAGALAGPAADPPPLYVATTDGPDRGAGSRAAQADDSLSAAEDGAVRRWSETAAWRQVAERLRLSIDRNPSVEGRRVLQVTIGLRLSF